MVVELTVCVVCTVGLGGAAVVVLITVVVAAVVAVADVDAAFDVDVLVWVCRALSGGTATPPPTRVTDTWEAPADVLVASAPAAVGAGLDLTALPTTKPMTIAATSAAPSSHHRCVEFTASLRPGSVSDPTGSGQVARVGLEPTTDGL